MALKDIIKKKVPLDLQQTPEFKAFWTWVKRKKFTTVFQMKRFVDDKIYYHQKWLNENKQSRLGTLNQRRRYHAKLLDFWRTIKKKLMKYF